MNFFLFTSIYKHLKKNIRKAEDDKKNKAVDKKIAYNISFVYFKL